ncbi:MAG: recombinase family protein [Oscillospiraceae bacterium]|nr:recombinase family protein [Oscillospiraceae bacterium]
MMDNTMIAGQTNRDALSRRYRAAIYCRLSKDDDQIGQSASIQNQREMLLHFCAEQGWEVAAVFEDDGYTGLNMNRPNFQKMLKAVERKEINLIVTKDMSRLGRDFVEVGRYTDVVFPSLGCRFISVVDCLDSAGDNTDMLHFRSLMNDYHLKDLSKKIKSVLYAKMRAGQYISAFAPYGYRKSENDRHRLVIDEESAAVVRRIFDMRVNGMAYGRIVAVLNREGILPPRWYWAIHYGSGSCNYAKYWSCSTVKYILRSSVYLGTVTQNTTGSRSYKDKTAIHKPENEWIIHEEACEAIIPREVWNTVQERDRQAAKASANNAPPIPGLFSGKLVCADCGAFLHVNRGKNRRKDGTVKQYVTYICGNYKSSGRRDCSRHRINELTLMQIVMGEIQAHAKALTLDEAAVLDKLRKQANAGNADHRQASRREIAKLRCQIQELEQKTAQHYEDKVTGSISAETFSLLAGNTEQERQKKAEQLSALETEVRRYEQDNANIRQWTALVRKYLNVQELDRPIVDELVERIEVGEGSMIDGQRHQDVRIYYRFVGLVE